jgi:hypothetical protein
LKNHPDLLGDCASVHLFIGKLYNFVSQVIYYNWEPWMIVEVMFIDFSGIMNDFAGYFSNIFKLIIQHIGISFMKILRNGEYFETKYHFA